MNSLMHLQEKRNATQPTPAAMRAAERIREAWTCHAMAEYPDIVNAKDEELAAVIDQEMDAVLKDQLIASGADALARCNAERDAARNERDALLAACEELLKATIVFAGVCRPHPELAELVGREMRNAGVSAECGGRAYEAIAKVKRK